MELYICNFKLGEIPLIAGVLTDTDVLTLEGNTLCTGDLIELRVDMFENTSIEYIIKVFKTAKEKIKKPIIATVRDVREGGHKEISDRLIIYKTIAPLSDVIDIEIGSEDIFEDIKNLCRSDKKILIGSYHNFESTPDDSYLESIVSRGKEMGADIVKIAVAANAREDLLRILTFTSKHKDKGLITMCMGDKGLPSRIISPLFGSLITYGYVRKPSAPGQLSVNEMIYIFRRLKMR